MGTPEWLCARTLERHRRWRRLEESDSLQGRRRADPCLEELRRAGTTGLAGTSDVDSPQIAE